MSSLRASSTQSRMVIEPSTTIWSMYALGNAAKRGMRAVLELSFVAGVCDPGIRYLMRFTGLTEAGYNLLNFLGRIAADHRILVQLQHGATDRPAFVPHPIHGRRGNFLGLDQSAGRRTGQIEPLGPIGRQ